ncbi:ABC transporter ATP-binding protein [Pseudoflavonifractor sp. SW1122]|nr:ABC transporter ATP-binding protein [Pseudoflavonifractor sp. SW1122]
MMSYISFKQVRKEYVMGEVTIKAVDGVDFHIEKGEFAIIVGPSGAGKTTVLNMLGGMDACTSGEILVDGTQVSGFNARQLTQYRRNDIGFVFQFYNLVQNLTALENVELAAQICKEPLDAKDVLEHVGLGHRLNNFPAQLSGGEQQRVAIARALAKNPKLLLCDEPTGALDYVTGKAILKLLQDTCRLQGMTVVVITHNTALTPMADRVIHIKNGRVEEMTCNPNPTPVEAIEW